MKRIAFLVLGATTLAVASQRPTAWDRYLPEEDIDPAATSFTSSRVCRSCHPSEYQSWYRSYHRTMTQWASEESIVPDWDGTDFGYEGRSYRLLKRDGTFFVDVPRPGTRGNTPGERLELPVVMTTGSHQMQYYWSPVSWADPSVPVQGLDAFAAHCGPCHKGDAGDAWDLVGANLEPGELETFWRDAAHERPLATVSASERQSIARYLERIQFPGRLRQFPFVYFIRDGRWMHDDNTFLQPAGPSSSVEPYGKHWNSNCDRCHSTGPSYRFDTGEQLGQTRIAELGIACEACHGPGRAHIERYRNPMTRYRAHLSDEPAQDIVNPARLDHRRSSSICAQCHAEYVLKSNAPFVPGEPIETSVHVLELSPPPHAPWLAEALDEDSHLFQNAFWPDGTIRIAGRDYNGLAASACYTKGELSCVSCHAMHGDDPNDQLRPEAEGDATCLGCHGELATNLESHTHHPVDSEASRCYSCHMPHTTWGLLGSVRAHRIDTPRIAAGPGARPNACNLCHLDRSLADMGEWLTRWYGQPEVDLAADDRSIAASVKWLLSGDAVQRGTAAWHMGYGPSLETSGEDWQPVHLAELLDDPYAAVRYRAYRSLIQFPGYEDLRYDFEWPAHLRAKARRDALGRFRPPSTVRLTVLIQDGQVLFGEIARLKARRDDTPIMVAE